MNMRLFLALCMLFPCAAVATRNVSSPVVDEGVWKSEARYGFEFDDTPDQDNRFRQFYYLEYGFTDAYAFRLSGRWSKKEGAGNDFVATELDQRLQLFEKDQDGWDGALRVIYALADNAGASDTLDVQWLAQKSVGAWNHRANIATQQEVGNGANGGVAWALSEQSLYKLNKDFAIGAEWFGTLGKLSEQHGISGQQHQLGPVVIYTFNPHVSLETGYLFGLTKPSSDGLFKLFLKASF